MNAIDTTQVRSIDGMDVHYLRMPDEMLYQIEQLEIEKGVVGFTVNLQDFSKDNKTIGVVTYP